MEKKKKVNFLQEIFTDDQEEKEYELWLDELENEIIDEEVKEKKDEEKS